MPPEPNLDRKELLLKERKHDRSEPSLQPRWRDAAPPLRQFNRWSKQPGHGKQGSWHMFSDDSAQGFASSRPSVKMPDDVSFRPSFSRGEGRYIRNGRDSRGSYYQRDSRGSSWESSSLSPQTPVRLSDMNNEQRPRDDNMTYSSNPQSDLESTWDRIQMKGHLDRVGVSNGVVAGEKCERNNSVGSLDWKPLKWSRAGSMSSRGSGFSHSSSSKSMGAVDYNEAKDKSQPKNVTLLQSASGDAAAACVTSAAPSDKNTSRKKPRLGWGEGLAKFEKKKVDPADDILNKDACPVGNVEPVQSVSLNLVDKSPRLTVLTDCASPATPSSVACSSSPGVQEKPFGKEVDVDNDINLYRSPDPVFQNHELGASFKLEKLNYNSLDDVSSSLHDLLQSEDPSPMDSSTVRPTAMNKLLIWKVDISKVLEVTKSEIDLLENELKTRNSDSGDTCQCPAASSNLPIEANDRSDQEQATATNMATRPAPLLICSSGHEDVEKLAPGDGEQGESCGLKSQEMDSPGTATSKFVDQLTLLNVASSYIGNSGGRAENQDVVQPGERGVECLASGEDEEKGDPSVSENSRSEIVTPLSDHLDDLNHCAGVANTLCDSIFSSNRVSASEAFGIFNKLLPKADCKVGISEEGWLNTLGISSPWKSNPLVIEMFKSRKRHLRLMEKLVTLKYKIHQQLWKEDVHFLSDRKYRPNSHKRYDLGLRNSSYGYQKHRSSIRSRFPTPGKMTLVPTKMVAEFAKMLYDSQVKLYRNSLKMPTLTMDNEKVVTKIVPSNGLIEDPCAVEKERALINPWMPEEKKDFIEKLATFGKDFKKIASFFDHKTTADCVEFYYKHHKSADFEKAKKKPDTSELGISFANTYMINPVTKWNREENAASLDILGAASVMAAQADDFLRNRIGRSIIGGYQNRKTSQSDDATVERLHNFDVIGDDRETLAADASTGICGSLSSEAVSSCITSSIDPGDRRREHKCQKVDSQEGEPLMPDVLQSVGDDTCSDDSCGEMDPSDWTDEEKSSFIQAVSSHGKDFGMISRCVRTRSHNQCKVFFSKARKHLGLDLVHHQSGNEGASIIDDANGSESDIEDECVVETGSGNSSGKSGCDTNEDFPLSVMDLDLEKTTSLQHEPPGSVGNNVKGEADHLNKKALKSSEALETEDRPKVVFDDLTNIMDVADRLSESVPARGEALSADAVVDRVIGKGSLVESDVGEGSSNLPKAEGQDDRCNMDASEGLLVSVLESNSGGSGSDMDVEASCSGLVAECLQQVSVECDSMKKSLVNSNSSLQEHHLATTKPLPENAVVDYGKAINQGRLSPTSAQLKDLDKLSSPISGDDVNKHLPGLPVLRIADAVSAHILKGYPLPVVTLNKTDGHASCGVLSEMKHLSKQDGGLRGHMPKECILQFGNPKSRSSQVDLPPAHQKIDCQPDTTKAHSWTSPDTDKPSMNGDVKLFGKILTSTSKSGSSIHEGEENGSHIHNLSNKPSSLKFSGHHNIDENSGVLKFDSSNYAGIKNVPRNYGFREGNKGKNGHPSLPDSAILLAKYPEAFCNFSTSSSKLEQPQGILLAKYPAAFRNFSTSSSKLEQPHVTGASVIPLMEPSSGSGSGMVDYRQVFGGRQRDVGATQVPPSTVDVKQRQDKFDVSRKNGCEPVSSLQQQGRGVPGMNGVSVVGREGIIVGGPCIGVTDPVAAIRLHFTKAEQQGVQGIVREESWRGKGDVGR